MAELIAVGAGSKNKIAVHGLKLEIGK